MMRRRLVSGVAALLAMAAWASAAAQESAGTPLSRQEAIQLALERNLNLTIERINLQIAKEQIREAEGQFDPLLGSSVTYNRKKRFLNSALESQAEDGLVRDRLLSPQASFTGKLITGTQYDLSLTTLVQDSDNPLRLFDESHTAALNVGITQPLLRDFGIEVNLVKVKQAENGERQTIFGVETKMLSVIRDVETTYWTMFYALQHVAVAQGDLDLAEDLVQRLTRMREAGLATALDLIHAQAAVEARRGDLARARADLLNAQAQLRMLIDPARELSARVIASEHPPEEGPPSDLPERVIRALARRPELSAQGLVIEQLELQEKLDKNNTSWRLDAIGNVGYSGLSGSGLGPDVQGGRPARLQGHTSFLDAFNGFFTPEGNLNWSVGVQLQIPIGNRQAFARLQETRLRKRQEEFRLSLLKSQISVEVETAFQDMSAAWEQLLGARAGVESSREQFAAEEKRLPAGLSTVRKVLEAQDDLVAAQDRENQALVRYASAKSRLDAADTTSFTFYQLVMQQ
jgi:outer membrane protein TolC